MDPFLPIAPAGAIRSNSFGPIPTNCSGGSNSEQFVWTNSSQLLPLEQFRGIHLDQFLPIAPAGAFRSNSFGPIPTNYSRGSNWEQFVWTNSYPFHPREQLGAIPLDQFLPIAPTGAIWSNSFGAIPSNCSGGSNSEHFVWTISYQLLQREELGAIHLDHFYPISPAMQFEAIRLDQFLPIAPAGAIRSNSFGPIPPNCSRWSNLEEFVWTNSSQLLPWEQFGGIRLDQFLPIAPAGAIRRKSFGPIPPNYSRGSNWEQFVWTNSYPFHSREQLGAIR